VRELAPGLLHWSVHYDVIDRPVSSYLVEPGGVVIDPLLPENGLEALARRAEPRLVVLTNGLHTRDAEAVASAFGCPIMTSHEGARRIGGALEVETYADGEEVAPGVRAIRVGVISDDEYALHITAATEPALAIADGVNSYGGALGFFEDELLGDDPEAVKAGLTEALRALAEREFDHLLLAHGDPVLGSGRSALRAFTDGGTA